MFTGNNGFNGIMCKLNHMQNWVEIISCIELLSLVSGHPNQFEPF